MDLGLLYEFDVPQPWAGDHPWGQRMAERAVYRDNIEQIVLADKLGFEAVWLVEHHFRENRSHMPSNEVVLGALSQITTLLNRAVTLATEAATGTVSDTQRAALDVGQGCRERGGGT